MGTATEQLKKEHAAIETMLKILDAICNNLRGGEADSNSQNVGGTATDVNKLRLTGTFKF
jgi:hypothetical protein